MFRRRRRSRGWERYRLEHVAGGLSGKGEGDVLRVGAGTVSSRTCLIQSKRESTKFVCVCVCVCVRARACLYADYKPSLISNSICHILVHIMS